MKRLLFALICLSLAEFAPAKTIQNPPQVLSLIGDIKLLPGQPVANDKTKYEVTWVFNNVPETTVNSTRVELEITFNNQQKATDFKTVGGNARSATLRLPAGDVASARLSLFVDTNVGITSKRKFGFNGTTFTASEENFALIQSGNSQVFINSIQMPQNQGDGNKKDFNLDWAISGIIAASIEVPFKSEATVTLTLQDGTKPSDTKKINGADTFAVVKIKAPTPPITAECTVKSFLKRVEQRQRDFVGSNFIPGVITEGKRN